MKHWVTQLYDCAVKVTELKNQCGSPAIMVRCQLVDGYNTSVRVLPLRSGTNWWMVNTSVGVDPAVKVSRYQLVH